MILNLTGPQVVAQPLQELDDIVFLSPDLRVSRPVYSGLVFLRHGAPLDVLLVPWETHDGVLLTRVTIVGPARLYQVLYRTPQEECYRLFLTIDQELVFRTRYQDLRDEYAGL